MKTIENIETYDGCQITFLNHILSSIVQGVEEHIDNKELAYKIVDSIAFSVCCDIDGSTVMEHEGKDLVPCLCFNENEETLNVGPSELHEYVQEFVNEIYGIEE